MKNLFRSLFFFVIFSASPMAGADYFAYLPSFSLGNGLHIINTTSNYKLSNLKLSGNGDAVAISPDNDIIYVAAHTTSGAYSNSLFVVDATTNDLVDTWELAEAPTAAAISPNGRWLLVAHNIGAQLFDTLNGSVRDLTSSTSCGAPFKPQSAAFTSDGQYAVMVCSDHWGWGDPDQLPQTYASQVALINTSGTSLNDADMGAEVSLYSVPTYSNSTSTSTKEAGSMGIAITSDNQFIYVANSYQDTVSVLTIQNYGKASAAIIAAGEGAPDSTIVLPGGTAPISVALSPKGQNASEKYLYISSSRRFDLAGDIDDGELWIYRRSDGDTDFIDNTVIKKHGGSTFRTFGVAVQQGPNADPDTLYVVKMIEGGEISGTYLSKIERQYEDTRFPDPNVFTYEEVSSLFLDRVFNTAITPFVGPDCSDCPKGKVLDTTRTLNQPSALSPWLLLAFGALAGFRLLRRQA